MECYGYANCLRIPIDRQEEHETKNMQPLSEVFTRKSVKKLTNALVKPP